MSAITAELGNVEYIFLRDLDCNGGATGAGTGTFVWRLPTLPPRESSSMYIQISQAMVHYAGTGATGNAEPQYLVYNNMYSDNLYSTNNSQMLACMLERDTATGHYKPQTEPPVIRVPSNLTQISFSVYNGGVDEINNTGLTGSVNILLKIIRPQHNVVSSNLIKSYVQSEIGNPPFNRL